MDGEARSTIRAAVASESVQAESIGEGPDRERTKDPDDLTAAGRLAPAVPLASVVRERFEIVSAPSNEMSE